MSESRDNIWTSIRNLKNSLTSRSLSQRELHQKPNTPITQPSEDSLQINSLSFTYEADHNNPSNPGPLYFSNKISNKL